MFMGRGYYAIEDVRRSMLRNPRASFLARVARCLAIHDERPGPGERLRLNAW
jgi:hypothetical protein